MLILGFNVSHPQYFCGAENKIECEIISSVLSLILVSCQIESELASQLFFLI